MLLLHAKAFLPSLLSIFLSPLSFLLSFFLFFIFFSCHLFFFSFHTRICASGSMALCNLCSSTHVSCPSRSRVVRWRKCAGNGNARIRIWFLNFKNFLFNSRFAISWNGHVISHMEFSLNYSREHSRTKSRRVTRRLLLSYHVFSICQSCVHYISGSIYRKQKFSF